MLADLCAARDLRVLLMAGPLRVVHVTAHRSLRDAIEAVTRASVLRTLELADDIGRRHLRRRPRIAVAGLNPHAGEHGILGDEDEAVIRPAVEDARSRGIDASGPLSADTLFPPLTAFVSTKTRLAPCAANSFAPAAPIPLAAPVISPARPASRRSAMIIGVPKQTPPVAPGPARPVPA